MRATTLRDAVRAHYLAVELPRDTVARMLARVPAEVARSAPARGTRVAWILAALAFLGLVAVGLRSWLGAGEGEGGPGRARAIAEEVAANHAHLRPLDAEAASFAELRRALDRFAFTLVEPAHPALAGLALVGGRYCSIQGRSAVQIRLRDSDGGLHTLYETRDAEFADVGAARITLDGAVVELWHEHGLFCALASAAR